MMDDGDADRLDVRGVYQNVSDRQRNRESESGKPTIYRLANQIALCTARLLSLRP
jgi:hypothetical protein